MSRNVSSNDLDLIKNSYYLLEQKKEEENKSILEKNYLFEDVYQTIKTQYYDKDNVKDSDLVYSAIEWLAKWTGDKHTVFFPPSENEIFQQSLTWDFEWIWAYVELSEPWIFIIQNPIPGSPAENAWLKWWDRIIKVGENEVTEDNPSEEIISWIKWPAGTSIVLTILRWGKELQIEVNREKIHINNIDYEVINSWTYYVQIKNFWLNVSGEFAEILKEIDKKIGTKKIIIDLRNNWGWFLDEVTKMLSYVIPEWEATAVIKYHGSEKVYESEGFDYLDLNDYKIVILQNSWTASASEIMIWTLKDYFPNITIIWETSYGKWSVQTIHAYSDWSSFKYTIAKWFTWKTETWIDWIWIIPDIELELDIDKYQEDWTDNQLEKALNQY